MSIAFRNLLEEQNQRKEVHTTKKSRMRIKGKIVSNKDMVMCTLRSHRDTVVIDWPTERKGNFRDGQPADFCSSMEEKEKHKKRPFPLFSH